VFGVSHGGVGGSSGASPTVKASNVPTSLPVPLYAARPMLGAPRPEVSNPSPISVHVAPSSSE
jgi:hypothetical protein